MNTGKNTDRIIKIETKNPIIPKDEHQEELLTNQTISIKEDPIRILKMKDLIMLIEVVVQEENIKNLRVKERGIQTVVHIEESIKNLTTENLKNLIMTPMKNQATLPKVILQKEK